MEMQSDQSLVVIWHLGMKGVRELYWFLIIAFLSICFAHEITLYAWLTKMHPVKILIRLCKCAGCANVQADFILTGCIYDMYIAAQLYLARYKVGKTWWLRFYIPDSSYIFPNFQWKHLITSVQYHLIWICTVCKGAVCVGLLGWKGLSHYLDIHSQPRWLNWLRSPTGDQEVAGSTPAEVGNILSWRLIMKYFLRSFSPFRWFKKGSCQFLAKECAQYWLTERTKPAP